VNDTPLVLSLFPGIGLLDMAFELEGFCVVRGPDLLWGGDVRRFHPPAGRFDGVIGGPPCQAFSPLVNVNIARGRAPAVNLIPEFERCVWEARPAWFVMENVPLAPQPTLPGYMTKIAVVNNRWFGGEQNRERAFTFGFWDVTIVRNPLAYIELAALEHPVWEPAVTGSVGGRRRTANPEGVGHQKRTRVGEPSDIAKSRPWPRDCELQGLPVDFDLPGFTRTARKKALGNGVPLPMGRAIAKAVRRAMQCASPERQVHRRDAIQERRSRRGRRGGGGPGGGPDGPAPARGRKDGSGLTTTARRPIIPSLDRGDAMASPSLALLQKDFLNYLTGVRGYAETTRRNYDKSIDQFRAFLSGGGVMDTVAEFTDDAVLGWMTDLAEAGREALEHQREAVGAVVLRGLPHEAEERPGQVRHARQPHQACGLADRGAGRDALHAARRG
jgi:DNA (cytosine-5)-methyltransferase 1